MAISLLPPLDIDKGTVTLDLIREYRLHGGLYLGDEPTDIDAFKAIHTATDDPNFQGFAIGITGPETPESLKLAADFTLNGVRDVERFLKWLEQNVPRLS
jgi:hypothetical protein